jgi:type IX secretion system PorP/SprF family membrane protein
MLNRLPLISCCTFLLFSTQTDAQQLSYFTQFRNAQGILNPASVNSDYFLYEYNTAVQATYRGQWVENPETPRTALLSVEHITDMRGERAFELLMGGYIQQDRTGPLSSTGYYGRFGSIFTQDPYFGAFSVGMTVGALQTRVDAMGLRWTDPDDPSVPDQNARQTTLDIGLGGFYYKRLQRGDNIYAGVSVQQLTGNDIQYSIPDKTVVKKQEPHFYLTAGWYHFVSEDSFWEVSAWAKHTKGSAFNLSMIGRFQFTRTIWVGGGFNLNGMTHLEAGFNIPNMLFDNSNLKIAYGVDYNLSAFGLPLGTSHEVTLAYMFGKD